MHTRAIPEYGVYVCSIQVRMYVFLVWCMGMLVWRADAFVIAGNRLLGNSGHSFIHPSVLHTDCVRTSCVCLFVNAYKGFKRNYSIIHYTAVIGMLVASCIFLLLHLLFDYSARIFLFLLHECLSDLFIVSMRKCCRVYGFFGSKEICLLSLPRLL